MVCICAGSWCISIETDCALLEMPTHRRVHPLGVAVHVDTAHRRPAANEANTRPRCFYLREEMFIVAFIVSPFALMFQLLLAVLVMGWPWTTRHSG
jgi:hypothetical protein